MAKTILLALNKLFKRPEHPFNLQNAGLKSYAQWQMERGEDTIKFYIRHTTPQKMFDQKTVLDIGCGAAGKTMYYANQGVKMIYGMDVVGRYRQDAEQLALKCGHSDRFKFICGDAACTDFQDNTLDTIIMNDAMEHVDKPADVLREAARILKPGGRLYVNFPPYNHPFGAHLSDAIGIPWVHIPFSDKTLINAYKELVAALPDGPERIRFRIARNQNGEEYFSYINKMTIRRFNKILQSVPLDAVAYDEIPLRNLFAPLARLPFTREFFVKMVVCILEKK